MLRRQIAPASKQALEAIDDEVRTSLQTLLAGRQVVDVHGPGGLDQGALNLGTLDVFETDIDGVTAGLRRRIHSRTMAACSTSSSRLWCRTALSSSS